jgi:hypothetical protein
MNAPASVSATWSANHILGLQAINERPWRAQPFALEWCVAMTSTSQTCSGCSRALPLSMFGRSARSPNGLDRICKACRKTVRDKPENKFKEYRRRAFRSNIAFELTTAHFEESQDSVCTYCCRKMTAPGLDRIDSSRGYTEDNIVPCCAPCNRKKGPDSEDEYLDLLFRTLVSYNPPERTQRAMAESFPSGFKRDFDFEIDGQDYTFRIRLQHLGAHANERVFRTR